MKNKYVVVYMVIGNGLCQKTVKTYKEALAVVDAQVPGHSAYIITVRGGTVATEFHPA